MQKSSKTADVPRMFRAPIYLRIWVTLFGILMALIVPPGLAEWWQSGQWWAIGLLAFSLPLWLIAIREVALREVILQTEAIQFRNFLRRHRRAYSDISRLRLTFRRVTIQFRDGTTTRITTPMGDLAAAADILVPRCLPEVQLEIEDKVGQA